MLWKLYIFMNVSETLPLFSTSHSAYALKYSISYCPLKVMKFGKRLKQHVQHTMPGWEDKYLCYKDLKKVMNHVPVSESEFVSLLDYEVDKFNSFFMEKEEDFIIRHQELHRRIRTGADHEQIANIRKDLIDFHGEMVLLINYSNINYTGLAKILKKYDKRTSAVLRLPFIQKVLNQPFYMTDLVSRLVKECELTIESMFPVANVEQRTDCLGIGAAGDGIFGNTVAALMTMQEMRRGSSTYSHFSLPPLNMEDWFVTEKLQTESSSPLPIASLI